MSLSIKEENKNMDEAIIGFCAGYFIGLGHAFIIASKETQKNIQIVSGIGIAITIINVIIFL